jgi:hypothetical protein
VFTVVDDELNVSLYRATTQSSKILARVNRLLGACKSASEKLQTLVKNLEEIKGWLRMKKDVPPTVIPTLDWLLSLEDDLRKIDDDRLIRDFRQFVLNIIEKEIIPRLGEQAQQVFYEGISEERQDSEENEPFQQLQKKLDELLHRLRKQQR